MIAAHNAHDADIPAAAALAAGDVAVIGRKAGGKDVIDLRGRAMKIGGQLISLQVYLGLRLLADHILDKLFDGIA